MPHECREGHRTWFESAVRTHEAKLLAYATRLLGDAQRGRDVVQDTFTRLWQQDRAAVDGRLVEWLYTVCRNRALDVREKEGQVVPLTRAGADHWRCPSPAPDDRIEQRDTHQWVLDALDRLPPRQQEILRLKFQGGLSYDEIAKVMGLSVSNVGFLLHTALKAMRQRLGVETTRVRT